MELKEFIAETLKQINDGLAEGSKYSESKGGMGVISNEIKISFDVGVTTSFEDLKEGGGKINVVNVLGIGGKASNKDLSTHYNRISFALFFNPSTNYSVDSSTLI